MISTQLKPMMSLPGAGMSFSFKRPKTRVFNAMQHFVEVLTLNILLNLIRPLHSPFKTK